MRKVVAADGGGSKTHVALIAETGELLGFARGPLSHVHHLGVAGSADVIDRLIAEAGGHGDIAVALLAGIDFPDEESAYAQEVQRRRWGVNVIVGNDTFAVLRAGSDAGWGVAVTCGAGINCVGVGPDGTEIRFPSLGEISGDWGGGRDVGLAALFAAARSEDRRGPKTALEQLVPEHFELASPAELARAINLGRIREDRLQELAPLTFAAAEEDAVAGEIVDRLADEVVAMANAALLRLVVADRAVDVILGGGLLQSGNRRLLGRIEAGIASAAGAAVVRVSDAPAIVGCALLGLDELAASPAAHKRARQELRAAVQEVEAAAAAPAV